MTKNDRDANFNKWFNNSKVVDENGNPKVVYHGASRPDRVGNTFLPSRATSGPMQFFTDDAETASGYATGKKDNSLEPTTDYRDWFKIKVSGHRNPIPIVQYWHFMDYQKKKEVMEKLPHVSDRDDEDNELKNYEIIKKYALTGKDHWDHIIEEKRGNYIDAAVDIWLDSGLLFGNEREFIGILKLAGIPNVEFHDPNQNNSAIFPVYLSIQNPFDTGNIPKEVVEKLIQVSKRKRGKSDYGAADLWDKRYQSGKQWITQLQDDIKNGTTISWTSIPDWVTEVLKRFGYDGIKDIGGKYHEKRHLVWIPFYSEQIKSATGNKGTFSVYKKSMIESTGTTMAKSITELLLNVEPTPTSMRREGSFSNKNVEPRKPKSVVQEVQSDWDYIDTDYNVSDTEKQEAHANDKRLPKDMFLTGDAPTESRNASKAKREGKRTAREISIAYGLNNDHIVDRELYYNLPPKPTEYHHFIVGYKTDKGEVVKRNMYKFEPEKNKAHQELLDNLRKYVTLDVKNTSSRYNELVDTLKKEGYGVDTSTGNVRDKDGKSLGLLHKVYGTRKEFFRRGDHSSGVKRKVLVIKFDYTKSVDQNKSRDIARSILKMPKSQNTDGENYHYLVTDAMYESLCYRVMRMISEILNKK